MVLESVLKDKFCTIEENENIIITCFAYAFEKNTDANLKSNGKGKSSSISHIRDCLFAGTLCGQVLSFPIAQRNYGNKPAERPIQPIFFPYGDKHYSQITTMLVSFTLLRSSDGVSDTKHECVISGSMDRTLKIWGKHTKDGLNFAALQTLSGHNGKISQVLATPHDGIISCSFDGTIRLYSRSSKAQAKPMDELISNLRYYLFECTAILGDTKSWLTSAVLLKAISPFGNWTVYVSNAEGDIVLYRSAGTASTLADNKHPPLVKHHRWPKVHQLEITSLMLIPNQSLIVTLSLDYTSKIIDTAKGVTFFYIKNPHKCRYTSVTWLPIGNYLLYSDEMGEVELLSINKEKSLSRISIVKHASPESIRIPSQLKLPSISMVATHAKVDNAVLTLIPNTSEILLLEFSITENCIEICGHNSPVIALSTMNANNLHHELATTNNQRIERQEMAIFSVEANAIIRCWDDYDNKFRFEVSEQASVEVTCMLVLWTLNSIATGHEDGSLFIWNLSTSTKQSSRIMRGAIVTGLTTLYLKPTDYMLIASDSNGRLAVINLLGQDNKKIAGELSVERIFQGYHGLLEDRERGPAIFSLACYEKEGILISGGEDCTLRVWGLLSHSKKNARVGGHSSCVTDMQVVGEALVTAEELGAVHMWRILSTSTDPSVSFHKLYSWPALSPSPSTDLFSLPSTKAIISSLLVQGEVYMSHSAENAEYTDIWKIQWYSAELSDVDADCRVVVTQLTCLSHEAFKITSANLNLFDSSNPLSRNRIFLGTTQGSILKFLI